MPSVLMQGEAIRLLYTGTEHCTMAEKVMLIDEFATLCPRGMEGKASITMKFLKHKMVECPALKTKIKYFQHGEKLIDTAALR